MCPFTGYETVSANCLFMTHISYSYCLSLGWILTHPGRISCEIKNITIFCGGGMWKKCASSVYASCHQSTLNQLVSVWCCNPLSHCRSPDPCDNQMMTSSHWGNVFGNSDSAKDVLFCLSGCIISYCYSCPPLVAGDPQSCDSSDYWADCGLQDRGDQLLQDKEHHLLGLRWDDPIKGQIQDVHSYPVEGWW